MSEKGYSTKSGVNKTILIFAVIALITAGVIFFHPKKSDKQKQYEIVMFIDSKTYLNQTGFDVSSRKIKMQKLTLDSVGVLQKSEKIDFAHPFKDPDYCFSPSSCRSNYGLNLIYYDRKKSLFYFGDNYNGQYKVIVIRRNSSGKYTLINEKNYNDESIYDDVIVDNCNDASKAYTNKAVALNLKSKNKTENLYEQSSHFGIIGAAYLKWKNLFFISSDSYINKANNRIISYNKVLKTTSEIYIGHFDFDSYQFFMPMAKSPDERLTAFLDYNQNESEEREQNRFDAALSFIDTKTLKTVRKVKYYEKIGVKVSTHFRWHEPIIIWNTNKKSPMMAVSDSFQCNHISNDYDSIHNPEYKYDSYEDQTNVFIYDYKNNKILERFNQFNTVKSMRWSFDNKKLGILAYEYSFDDLKQIKGLPAKLYIYDLDTKKLTKLMDCPDCFDFHFVE